MKTQRLLTAAGLGMLFTLIFIIAAGSAGATVSTVSELEQPVTARSDTAGMEGATAASTWYSETIDSGGVGLFTSMSMSGNTILISYFDANNGDLLFTTSTYYQDWFTETVDSLGPGNASYTSVAEDPTTFAPQISYHDWSNDRLNYASRAGTWVSETVAVSGGNYNDLVLEPNSGIPHISFYEFNKGELIHAYKDTAGNWFTDTVDSDGNVGMFTSIALDPSGHPNISYYDVDKQDLKLAYWNGNEWIQRTIDSTGDVGWDTSLGVDIAGNVHISYYDYTDGNLNYAFYDHSTSSWMTQTVDSTGDVGWYTSLAVDSNNQPHISYYDFTNNQLNYATLSGATWFTETVDASSADIGKYSSIGLDYRDRPHISYYDEANGSLKLATTYQRSGLFIVNDNADMGNLSGDMNPGDGICMNLSGECTLRAAIEEANAWPGDSGDLILFKNAMTITLSAELPVLNSTIYLQGDTVWDTVNHQPGVKIDGNQNGIGLSIYGDESQVSGLYLTNFTNVGIVVYGADNIIGGYPDLQTNVVSGNSTGIAIQGNQAKNNRIIGNYIGVTPDGSSSQPNTFGITIGDGATKNFVGADDAALGNVISGNETGIWVGGVGTADNKIGGNLIGLKPDGTSSLKNETQGIYIHESASGTCIGCGSMAANTIRNNGYSGIVIYKGVSTTIQGNDISANEEHGIHITESNDNQVISNTIHINAGDGVRIFGTSSTGNTLSENSITGNGSKGILLLSGANGELISPEIENATKLGAYGTTCAGCTIEIFSDDFFQGRTYEGSAIADSQGGWQFNGVLSGPNVTATATDADGNTSMYSWKQLDISEPLIYLPLVLNDK